MSYLQYIAMRETHTNIQIHLHKLHILHLPFIHVTDGYIVMHNLIMLFPIILHTKPNHTIFLFNMGRLLKLPLRTV